MQMRSLLEKTIREKKKKKKKKKKKHLTWGIGFFQPKVA
jgi:hypothetical protein